MRLGRSSKREARRARRSESGAAWLIVLMTFATLSVMAAQFAKAMRLDAETTKIYKQGIVSQYVASDAMSRISRSA